MTTEEITSVPVHLKSIEPGLDISQGSAPKGKRYRTMYETFILNANEPAQCILGQSDDRCEFWVLGIDNDFVLGPTKGVVAAPVNTVAGVPSPNGGYFPKLTQWGPFRDNGQVYAGATTVATNSRVTVIATYLE